MRTKGAMTVPGIIFILLVIGLFFIPFALSKRNSKQTGQTQYRHHSADMHDMEHIGRSLYKDFMVRHDKDELDYLSKLHEALMFVQALGILYKGRIDEQDQSQEE